METNSSNQSSVVGHGRYRLLGRLGQGHTGAVYEAVLEEYPEQRVALKVLAPEHLGNRKMLRRFQNELEACYRISHPNVVKPIEVVREKELFGFSMELVDGENLAQILRRGPLPEEVALPILRKVASALDAVHAAGVLHRDLKPENILISKTGVVKLTDFGTALLMGGPRLTSEGNVLGSIPYLAPEYIETQSLDERSDLYSLGVLAHEMVTGEVPFQMSGIVEIVNQKLHGETFRMVSETVSPGLCRAIEKLLRSSPNERFQSAKAVEEEFRLLELEGSRNEWGPARHGMYSLPPFKGASRTEES